MAGNQTLFEGDTASDCVESKFFATRNTFVGEMFDGVSSAEIISYCASPSVILSSFRETGLDRMRLLIGNSTPNEALGQDDVETVRELTELIRQGRLELYYAPNYEVHTKMYWLRLAENRWRLATGSANFTRNGWGGGRQANHLNVAEVSESSDYYQAFTADFEEHFERYGEPYLDDLSETIEQSDEDSEEIIARWLGAENQARDDIEAISSDIKEMILEESENNNFESKITLSADRLKELPDEVLKQAEHQVQTAGGEVYQYDRSSAASLVQRAAGLDVPIMNFDSSRRSLLLTTPHSNQTMDVRRSGPDVSLSDSLRQIHQYFDYVDEYGVGSDEKKQTVKMYMYEVLLYMFWAPLFNLQIHYDLSNDMRNLEKNIPFLYIHGVTSTGKGTFVEYCLRLISNGLVDRPVSGDELGKTILRQVRSFDSSFPIVFDDVKKDQIRNCGNVLNKYWEPLITRFDGSRPNPAASALVFTSNDNRPGAEILERAELFEFDVQFPEAGSKRRERDIEQHKQKDNALFAHFLDELLAEENGYLPPVESVPRDHPLTSNDILGLTREIFQELYEKSGVDKPGYFPHQPAKKLIDFGRRNWRERIEHDECSFEYDRDEGVIQIEFPTQQYSKHEINEMIKDIPTGIASNPKRRGTNIHIQGGKQFMDWITRHGELDEPSSGGMLQRLGRLLGP